MPEAGDLRKNLLSLPLAPDMRSTGPKKQGLSGSRRCGGSGFTRARPLVAPAPPGRCDACGVCEWRPIKYDYNGLES